MRTTWRSGFISAVAFVALSVLASPAYTASDETSTVTVVTSFPASFYEPFLNAFEARHPQWRMRVVNRKTGSAISHIQSGRDLQLDLFWASAPDAFEVLKASGHLAPVARRPFDIPENIGRFPINDPDGYYLGFALSGYGLIWNEAYLARHGLPPPADWDDLADPAYAGHLALSPPSRSGTTHLMIETILQNKGWEPGWALLLEIGGNLATLTARSYSVAEGVARQRFGIGISIDFLGLSYTARDSEIRFVYPRSGPFLPASIAILDRAPNRPAAEAFVDFLLSEEGQTLLTRDDILRLPVRPDSYTGAPPGYPNPYSMTRRESGPAFDSVLSSRRYDLVNLLFDELITYRLPALTDTWRAIHRAEGISGQRPDEKVRRRLESARRLASAVPLTESDASDPDLASALRPGARGVPASASRTELEVRLRSFSDERLGQARREAELALEAMGLGDAIEGASMSGGMR